MKATPEQQLGFLARNTAPILRAIVNGYDYNPGDSDLDNEQTIHVRMTLGDYRAAALLLIQLEKPQG